MPTVGSLFSGVGGMDLAFERSGFKVLWQVEINGYCRSVLAKHFPEAERFEDVQKVGKRELRAVDVICGGSPCQDLSVAGRRRGLDGERSGLFFEFVRIADSFPAARVLFENVPGLLSSQSGRDFACVLGGLSGFTPEVPRDGWRNSGMCCGSKRTIAWCVLDAQYFGLAQRRERVFIVGSARGSSPIEILFEPESVHRDTPPSRNQRANVARSLTASTGGCSAKENQHTFIDANGRPLNALNTKDILPDVAWALQERDHKGPDSDTKDGHLVPVFSFEARIARNGRGAPEEEIVAPLKAESGRTGKGDSAPLRAVPSLEYNAVRRLTTVEFSRLQGFPDTYLVLDSDYAEESQAHAAQILRTLYRETGTYSREGRGSRIALTLLTPEVLLSGVHGGWLSWEMAAEYAAKHGSISSTNSWPDGFLGRLQETSSYRPSPYRRESFQQLSEELGRPLQELPLTEAQARTALLSSELWAEAQTEWPMQRSRPTSQARSFTKRSFSDQAIYEVADTSRYKALGNAVAVPVIEWIAKRMLTADTQ